MNKQTSVDQLLLDLEKNSISDREKADILIRIIEIESSKSEKDADMELIQECVEFLNILTNSEEEIEMQESQAADRLQQIYQKAADDTTPVNTGLTKHQPGIRKRRLRFFGLIAASFAVVILIAATSLTVIARVNGYGNMWEWLSEHLSEIFQVEPEKDHTIEGITVIRGTDTKTYSNMESWLQEESWDILYPSELPDGVWLDHILLVSHGEGETSIFWSFNTTDVRFSAQNFDLASFEPTENMEILEIGGYRFGIFSRPDGTYQASCVIGDFAYSIECANHENLLFLINHLKGIEK